MTFIAIIIGLITGVLFYSCTVSSYKKAGAGQTYSFEASTDVDITRRLDSRTGTRSSIDHGFYSGSVSASGRAQAYHMPQSVKHSIEQAKEVTSNRPGVSGARPSAVVRPSAAHRPPTAPRPSSAPRPSAVQHKPGVKHRGGR